jgi:hypothetical protein
MRVRHSGFCGGVSLTTYVPPRATWQRFSIVNHNWALALFGDPDVPRLIATRPDLPRQVTTVRRTSRLVARIA